MQEREKIESLLRAIRQDIWWLAWLIFGGMILQLILHWSCLKTR